MNKAAIYCRLSNEDNEKPTPGAESQSIINQKLLLYDYAVKQGFLVQAVYTDEDYSGLDRDRPGFGQMIKDAESGLFDIVLVKTQSRFTRDMEMVEKYIHGRFPAWGIRFIGVLDNVDTKAPGNKKARQIYGLINEWYSEDLSENIRAVLRKKMENGQFIGSFAPYGYKKDAADPRQLVVDDVAAAVVRDIFDMYIGGTSGTKIAESLNRRGILAPTAYKQKAGLKYRNPAGSNALWGYSTVVKMLKNPVYIGSLVQGKERKVSYKSRKIAPAPRVEWVVVENNHAPIVSREVFDLAAARQVRRAR